MKKIYSILLACIALMIFVPKVNATDPPYTEGEGLGKGLAYSKKVLGPENGIYTIKLESFVTGEITMKQGVPADIVLVLDVSGSMDRPYGSDEYEALPSANYSYDSYGEPQGEDQMYYLYNNNYYPVSRITRDVQEWVGGWGGHVETTTYYGLTFERNNRTYFLKGTSANQAWYLNNSNGVTSTTETIWTGILYKKVKSQTTRLGALKAAVGEFIDVIKENGELSQMDNKISIVKFAMAQFPSGDSETNYVVGDYDYDFNESGYERLRDANYTQVVADWTSVATGAQTLKDAVNGLHASGATAVDYGLNRAQLLLSQSAVSSESAKTIVVFTDGAPTHSSDFDNNVANAAISTAKDIKNTFAYHDSKGDHNATVYTVGVFDNETTQIKTYMDRLSSNFPNATGMGTGGEGDGGSEENGFYQNADDGDLSTIFRNIAASSGGAAAELDASAVEAVDVVSQSFELPDGASTDITVLYVPCTGKVGNYLVFDDDHPVANPAGEGHVTVTISGENNNIVKATGFKFSEEWCGPDASTGGYHGNKLVLLIPIKMSQDAVGGQGALTNGENSGIYVNGKNILPFKSPDVDLPTNIHIKKVGLSTGESAIFKLYRTPANEDGSPKTPVNWEHFKTVIIIEGVNEDSTVKLRGLNPNFAYKIVEDGWSWAYDTTNPLGEDGQPLTEVTSDKLITNPFIFTNTPNAKGKTIIHAESAVVNDWSSQGKQEGIDSKNTAPKTASNGSK